jgi:hypothetical protein
MYKIHFLRLKVSYIGFIVGLYCVILVFRYKNEESPLGGSLGYHGSKVNLVADIIRCVWAKNTPGCLRRKIYIVRHYN